MSQQQNGNLFLRRLFDQGRFSYYKNREKVWALAPALSEPIEAYYQQLVIGEGQAAGINNNSSVLLIGSGATPYTAKFLAEEFHCSVMGIDKEISAIFLSRLYLHNKCQQLPVTVKWGYGEDICSCRFDVVFLTLHARPKEKIVQKILSQNYHGKIIIVRNPKPEYRCLYDALPLPLFSSPLTLEKAICHPQPYRFDTLLFSVS